MHRGLGEIRVTKEILVHEFPRVILVQKSRKGDKGDTSHQSPKGDKDDIGIAGKIMMVQE